MKKIQKICMKDVLGMGALAFLVLLKWCGI